MIWLLLYGVVAALAVLAWELWAEDYQDTHDPAFVAFRPLSEETREFRWKASTVTRHRAA